jgi:uncharacterized membrane protein YeaQ/YmgE (transglycosylase-associated protein family)
MPRTVSAREPHPQSVGYLAKAITYATTGIGTANTVLLGVLPARVTTGLGTLYTADTPLYIKYSQTGTAATAGAATIAVTFIRASDG